jgi:carboxypeptidase Taq
LSEVTPRAYARLRQQLRETATLSSVAHLLNWDQETVMPPKAADFRAEELALLARLAHERATAPQIGELLARCESDLDLRSDPEIAANLREIRRDYDRARKLPAELVAEIRETGSRAMEVWKRARQENNFSMFVPWLERHLELVRRKARCLGAPDGGELYDALLDEFEPEMTSGALMRIFAPLRERLVPLIAEIRASGREPSGVIRQREIPLELQRRFNRRIVEAVGFDLEAGRLDVSVHPFASGLAPRDTRITTRYRTDQFSEALSSTLHEAGHGLYEQGLPKSRHFGEPLGEALGLGIHESQSRLWENQVGRSRAFWEWALPLAAQTLGPGLGDVSIDEVYHAVNTVRPNLIRVDSDEATYNLHIMLRFDLETQLFRGELAPADLPGAWNRRIRDDLGLEVPDDARGCLQDVHWSMGAIGYFPTYTLGNLYAAQFWEAIVVALPDLDQQMAQGEFSALLAWLRENIHEAGRRFPADELCRNLTGKPLSHEPLMRHLSSRLRPIYGLD